MNAPHAPQPRLPVRRTAGARRGVRRGSRRAVDQDAAAVRARPHQPVAAGGSGRLDARRLRLRRRDDARAVADAFRERAVRPADRADHRDTLPPRPSGQCAVAERALRLPRRHDAGRVPDRARGAGAARRRIRTRTSARCSRRTAWRPISSRRWPRAATPTIAACRKCRAGSTALSTAMRWSPAASRGASSAVMGIPRSTRRCIPRRADCSCPATCCCRGSAPT